MTIGEFSVITGISAYTLRYYEKKGLLRVNRDSGGRRDYSEDDIEWVKFIRRLKDTGMLLRILGIILICGIRETTRWRSGWIC